MDSGLPKDLPAGVVDMDDSSTSRNIVRNLDAFSQTGVVAHYSNVSDARIAVQEGKSTDSSTFRKVCPPKRKANGNPQFPSIPIILI